MKSKFDIRDNILYKYTGEDETIYIPESVLIIKEKAFRLDMDLASDSVHPPGKQGAQV